MKVRENEQNPTLTSGEMMTVDMGISESPEDQLMILNVLTNTLYTDKLAAVLREYGCNAYDANVEAGKGDVPIEVRLPNKLEPTLSIRDFGFGMTQEQILTVFCKLGRSTKRSSNEFTGMLGIGSKAGFAYGDQFNVTSWAKGTKTVYSCYRDKGLPRLARLDKRTNTGEPDGIEVKIPVFQQDIPQFAITAERVYRYFKVQPKITGAKIEFRKKVPQREGTGWRFVGDGKSLAVMGNIGYDLWPASLGDKLPAKARLLLTLGIELDFNIGELEIAANREGLQYKDVTTKAIISRLTFILTEIGTLFTKQIAGAKSMWEAKKTYHELFEKRGNYGQQSLRDAVSDKIVWNGQPVNTGRYDLGSKYDVYKPVTEKEHEGLAFLPYALSGPTAGGYRRRHRETHWLDWYAREDYLIIVNDLPKRSKSPTREAGFWRDHPNTLRALVLGFTDDKAQKKWWDKFGLDGSPFVLMSTITPLKTANSATYAPSKHRSKHQASAFELIETGASDHNTASANWSIVSVDTDTGKGGYVSLERFDVIRDGLGYGSSAGQFKTMIKELRAAGLLKAYPKVYGFKEAWLSRKQASKNRLGAGWVRLDAIIEKEVQAYVKAKEQEYANWQESQSHHDFVDTAAWKDLPKGSAFHDYVTQLATMKQCNSATLFDRVAKGHYARWLGSQPAKLPKPVVALDALLRKALSKYPMLNLWSKGTYYYTSKDLKAAKADEIKLAIEYIKMVDSI